MFMSDQKRHYNSYYKLALSMWFFSFIFCALYFFGAMARSGIAFESLVSMPKSLVILWKGLAEGLLVLASLIVARSGNSLKLALSIFMIFIADMVLALGAVPAAGLIFAMAHLLAAFIYLSSSLNPVRSMMKLISLVPILLVLAVLIYSVVNDNFQIIVVFPIFSAIATLGALRSDYPWFLNGVGTTLIWVSDMLFVFAVLSWGTAVSVGWLVWLTFSSGLLLIVLGLVKNRIQLSALEAN